jgi:putative ABC transport system ATP-binding protein
VNDSRPVVLSARAVVKSYGPTPALRGISVDVHAGEVLAVTGPSGSGKSTLLLCLAGILRPDAGEVHYGEERVDTLSEARRAALRRSEVGILFQFGQLVPELTAEENVALPLLLDGTRRAEAFTSARIWLDRFGVGDVAGQTPGAVSGGQQQRIAVARAMVTGPKVLFADEPTGALDSVSGDQVLAEMLRVARESGTTVVLVTHDSQVAAYAEREIVVRDGVLAPDGYGLTPATPTHSAVRGG